MDRPAYLHFVKRARERFGLVLTERLVLNMEDCIRKGFYSRICEQGEGLTLYRVPAGKRMAAVAYNRTTETVVTIMPIEWTTQSHRVEREVAAAGADNSEREET